MMTKRKMYKKGLADALKANEAFAKKQQDAIEFLREEVRAGNKKLEEALTGLGEDIFGIYDYLNSREKEALYKLGTPSIDIKELDEQEKRLLLAILYQLADDSKESITDEQRSFIRSVQHYVDIVNPQTFAEYEAICNIDSLEVQKVFLQLVLEFMYLQESDEYSELYESVLDNFSVNRKQSTQIEFEVSRMFNLVGVKGISEKYGYVPIIETEDDVLVNEEIAYNDSYVGIPLEIVSRLTKSKELLPRGNFFETKDFFVFEENENIVKFDKHKKQESLISNITTKCFSRGAYGVNYQKNSFMFIIKEKFNDTVIQKLYDYNLNNDTLCILDDNLDVGVSFIENQFLNCVTTSNNEEYVVFGVSKGPSIFHTKKQILFYNKNTKNYVSMVDGDGKELIFSDTESHFVIKNCIIFYCDNDGYVDKNGVSIYEKICIYDINKNELSITDITNKIKIDCNEYYFKVKNLNYKGNDIYISVDVGFDNLLCIYKADISDLHNIVVTKCAKLSKFYCINRKSENKNYIIALTKDYDLYAFNIETDQLNKIASDCYTYYVKEGFFKDKRSKVGGNFKIIAQWLFYEHMRDEEIYRVNVEYPMTGSKI